MLKLINGEPLKKITHKKTTCRCMLLKQARRNALLAGKFLTDQGQKMFRQAWQFHSKFNLSYL